MTEPREVAAVTPQSVREWHEGEARIGEKVRDGLSLSGTELSLLQIQFHRDCASAIRGLQAAYDAAVAYIEASPCDPDIYAHQWEAWQRFDAARRALSGSPETQP